MSYNIHKLSLFIDGPEAVVRANTEAAKQYVMAEDDNEVKEMRALMHPLIHFSSFWGVARGFDAAYSLLLHEQEHLRLVWTTPLRPITATTFVREGYAKQLLAGGFLRDLPVVGPLWCTLWQQKALEELVVRNGKVVFRHVGYRWAFGLH